MQYRDPENNIPGIDVSHHQGVIDWLAVASTGYRFAYVKASEGTGYVDQMFRRNAVGAPAAGLKVGFYHYARPETGNAPQQEAGAFLEAIAGLPCDLPLVLDVEGAAANVGPDTLTDWVYEWLTEVQRRTGNRVMVYTYAAFARENLGAKLADFPLWIAHYGVDRPGANATWSDWAVFQYASDGNVLGIDGNVDVDEMDINFWKGLFEVSEETNDAPQITEDAANKVIADLGALYEACADEDVKAAAHLAAEALRQAAGITEEE